MVFFFHRQSKGGNLYFTFGNLLENTCEKQYFFEFCVKKKFHIKRFFCQQF